MEILFISSGSIGDAIISTGILSHLMDEYPEAEFTLACGPAAAPLFMQCPRIKRVIPIVKRPWNRHWFHLWQETNQTKWDLIVDLRGSLISYILNTQHRVIFRKADKSLSKAEQLAALFSLQSPPPTRLWVNEDTATKARNLLPHHKNVIVLAPRTNSAAKDWPLDRFATLAHKLYKNDVLFVVLASGLQQQSIKPLLMTMAAEHIVDLSGQTDLLTAYAIIQDAKLFIGNDSGLLHMAAAAKTPCVGIYGPSNDKTYAPHGPHVRIVTAMDFKPGEEEKRDNRFMQMISVEKVEEGVRQLNAI